MKLPYLQEYEYFKFPEIRSGYGNIIAKGGNLSPGMLLSAYRQGIFPWYNEGTEIHWWCPNPRFVLFPQELHIRKTIKKKLRKTSCIFTVDKSFANVVLNCAHSPRKDQNGTWITNSVFEAYSKLNNLGYAHSVECWLEQQLVGGLYGIALGSLFFGESMFSRYQNSSEMTFIALLGYLKELGFTLVDCQMPTDYLGSLGARNISRTKFLELLIEGVAAPTIKGNWTSIFTDFPKSRTWEKILNNEAS